MDDLVQDFYIRPEGETFDLSFYETYTNLFTIKCHYYGKFNDGPKKEYIEGETCFVDLVNRDQFKEVVLNTVINSLGYEMEDEVLYYYKIPLKSLDVGLKPLVSESDYRSFLGYVEKHKVMDVYVEIVEKNEESDSGSDSDSQSDNDFEDEEHVVQEVEVNMNDFNFQVEDVSTGNDGNDPIAPNVNVTEDNIEVLDFDSLESYLKDVPENARSLGLRKLKKKHSSSKFFKGREFANRDLAIPISHSSQTGKRYCVRHIYENMNQTWKGSEYKEMLWKCAPSTTTVLFEKNMQELKDFNKKAYEWLKKILAEHWSGAYFSGRAHCDLLINNICEVFNRQLLDARDSPIITALEHVREYLMKRIVIVQKIIEKCDGPLTPAVAKVFDIIKEASSGCIVDWNGADLYQVKGFLQEQYVVNLSPKTCSCRKWEISGIPCKHVIAAIHDMADNDNDVGIPEDWVHDSYKLATWKAIYSHKVNPVNGRELWSKFDCPTTLLPPKIHPQIGRPPKKRKKSKGEIVMVKGNKLTRQGGTSNATGTKRKTTSKVVAAEVGTQASQGGTSNAAGTKRKSTSKVVAAEVGTQASQASKGGTSNA
ncbi:mutator type transposase [Tanacetum coccineum]